MFPLNPGMLFLVGVGQTHVGDGEGPQRVVLSLRQPHHRVAEVVVAPVFGLAEDDCGDQGLVGHGQGPAVVLVRHQVRRLLHDVEGERGHHVPEVGRNPGQAHLVIKVLGNLERAELALLIIVGLPNMKKEFLWVLVFFLQTHYLY